MNIGVDRCSKDDESREDFHTRVFRNKRRIALWNTNESEPADDSSITCAYVYINGCARECASSTSRSAWTLRIIDNLRWGVPAKFGKSQRVAASIYGTTVKTLFFLIKWINTLKTKFGSESTHEWGPPRCNLFTKLKNMLSRRDV